MVGSRPRSRGGLWSKGRDKGGYGVWMPWVIFGDQCGTLLHGQHGQHHPAAGRGKQQSRASYFSSVMWSRREIIDTRRPQGLGLGLGQGPSFGVQDPTSITAAYVCRPCKMWSAARPLSTGTSIITPLQLGLGVALNVDRTRGTGTVRTDDSPDRRVE